VPLKSYGVLIGRAVDRRRESDADSPHFQICVADDAGVQYRLAVNVKSQLAPSELLYLIDDDLKHPVTAALGGRPAGWHALPPHPGGPNLDFIRGNLFDPARMRPLPFDVSGPDNDLADLIDHYVHRAIGDPAALVYAFGERWGPERNTRDKIFGFLPGNGVHDIHMNQGNSGRFRADDGVWQDGALLIQLAGESRWVGIFLAFQSQAWHTDDTSGHAIDGIPQRPESTDALVRIVAARVNPVGPAPEDETVLLLNVSPHEIDLTGWRIADRMDNSCLIPVAALPAGATVNVHVSNGVQLGNKGGTITLLDTAGLKVSGVSYTADQARREGWTIAF
jgi:uncharacterized protein YukJ